MLSIAYMLVLDIAHTRLLSCIILFVCILPDGLVIDTCNRDRIQVPSGIYCRNCQIQSLLVLKSVLADKPSLTYRRR